MGQRLRVAYDQHNLLVTQTTDAAGNTTCRKDQLPGARPWLVTDPNLNRSGVRYDPLGMVIATAVMGKLLPDGTDEGDHLDTTTAEPSAERRPDHAARLRPDRLPDLGGRPVARPRPSHSGVGCTTRPGSRHKDPRRRGSRPTSTATASAGSRSPRRRPSPGRRQPRDGDGNLFVSPEECSCSQPTQTRWVGTGPGRLRQQGQPGQGLRAVLRHQPRVRRRGRPRRLGRHRDHPLRPAVQRDPDRQPQRHLPHVELDPWQHRRPPTRTTPCSSAWYAARSTGQLGPTEADAAAKAAAHADTPRPRPRHARQDLPHGRRQRARRPVRDHR